MIATEPMPKSTPTFHAWAKANTNVTLFWVVMFQIVATCMYMESIDLTHGDLHAMNIFILDLPVEVELTYILPGGLRVRFSSRVVAMFFDWDRSYWRAKLASTRQTHAHTQINDPLHSH